MLKSNVFYILNLTNDFLIWFHTLAHLVHLITLVRGERGSQDSIRVRLFEVHPTNSQSMPLPIMTF